MDDIYVFLGKRIREQRLKTNQTIQQLAEKADISDNYLGNIERGAAKPSMLVIIKIANALSVGLNDIYSDSLDCAKNYSSISPVRTEINKGLDFITEKEQEFVLHTVNFLKENEKK